MYPWGKGTHKQKSEHCLPDNAISKVQCAPLIILNRFLLMPTDNNFTLSSIPLKDELNSVKIKNLWKEAEAVYGKPCWDDIVLTLNGVPHKNFIKSGDSLYFPGESSIRASFDKGR